MSQTNKTEPEAPKKEIVKWCLSVDLEGGDGADLFPIDDPSNMENFWGMLELTNPPPKVEMVGLTAEEWAEAERVGREREDS